MCVLCTVVAVEIHIFAYFLFPVAIMGENTVFDIPDEYNYILLQIYVPDNWMPA